MLLHTSGHPHRGPRLTPLYILSCFSGLTLGISLPCYHMGWAIWLALSVCRRAGRIQRKAGVRREK